MGKKGAGLNTSVEKLTWRKNMSKKYRKTGYLKKSGTQEETVAIAYPEDSKFILRFFSSQKYGDRIYIAVEQATGKRTEKFYLDIPNAAELMKILARYILKAKGRKYLKTVLWRAAPEIFAGESVKPSTSKKKEEKKVEKEVATPEVEYVSLESQAEVKKKLEMLENGLATLTSKVAALATKIDALNQNVEILMKSMPHREKKK